MQAQSYPPATGAFAALSEEEKKKRLDAMVQLWQRDTEHRMSREDYTAFRQAVGLDEYRYSVWLRFPEWERSVVVGQVLAASRSDRLERPTLFSAWRREPLLKTLPDWKIQLPQETVFNIAVRITPGGLGEGSRWAVMMPKELIPRYKPGWPTQQQWVSWTRSFDWLSVAVGFIREMLDAPGFSSNL
jgi:hypothetical protein